MLTGRSGTLASSSCIRNPSSASNFRKSLPNVVWKGVTLVAEWVGQIYGIQLIPEKSPWQQRVPIRVLDSQKCPKAPQDCPVQSLHHTVTMWMLSIYKDLFASNLLAQTLHNIPGKRRSSVGQKLFRRSKSSFPFSIDYIRDPESLLIRHRNRPPSPC